MADAWIANPQVTPSFPPGLHIREAGRRIKLDPVKLTEATAYERVEPPDGVEFYAILADGTEITAKRSFGAYGQP